MLYKYLFFFFSYLEKKYDPVGDPYTPAYILMGLTFSINLFVAVDITCILFFQNNVLGDAWMKTSIIIGAVMMILSTLYYKHNNRGDKIYNEVCQSTTRQKFRYGLLCLFYVVLSYGLWFACNDVMHVLKKGSGLSYAESIVETLKLTYW